MISAMSSSSDSRLSNCRGASGVSGKFSIACVKAVRFERGTSGSIGEVVGSLVAGFGVDEVGVNAVMMGLSIKFTNVRSVSFSASSCLVCNELPPLFQTLLMREILWKVFGGVGSCISNCSRL